MDLCWLVGWLVGGLVGWLDGWLVGWLPVHFLVPILQDFPKASWVAIEELQV